MKTSPVSITSEMMKKVKSYNGEECIKAFCLHVTGKSLFEHEYEYMKDNWDYDLPLKLVEQIDDELSRVDIEAEIQQEMLRAAEKYLKDKYNQLVIANPWKEIIKHDIVMPLNMERLCLTVKMNQQFPETKGYEYDDVTEYFDTAGKDARKEVRRFFTNLLLNH